jgi:hypothetical protein
MREHATNNIHYYTSDIKMVLGFRLLALGLYTFYLNGKSR